MGYLCESRVERKIVKILDLTSFLKDDQVFFHLSSFRIEVKKYTFLKKYFQPLI